MGSRGLYALPYDRKVRPPLTENDMLTVNIGKSKYRVSMDMIVEKYYRGEWILVKQGKAMQTVLGIARLHRLSGQPEDGRD